MSRWHQAIPRHFEFNSLPEEICTLSAFLSFLIFFLSFHIFLMFFRIFLSFNYSLSFPSFYFTFLLSFFFLTFFLYFWSFLSFFTFPSNFFQFFLCFFHFFLYFSFSFLFLFPPLSISLSFSLYFQFSFLSLFPSSSSTIDLFLISFLPFLPSFYLSFFIYLSYEQTRTTASQNEQMSPRRGSVPWELSGFKLTPDLHWNSYIQVITKYAGKMIGFMYRFSKYLTPRAIPYLYKSQSQITPRMEYCCHSWVEAAQTSLSSLERVQKRLRFLVGDELFPTLQLFLTGRT